MATSPPLSQANKPTFSAYAIVGLTILAPALGGSTQLWAQGILLLATGILFLAAPPARSLTAAANLIYIVLIGIALAAFLPASWFGLPTWRVTLMEEFPGQFPGTRSPQPWITLQNFLLFLAALAWAYYLQCRLWNGESRRKVLWLYIFGIALLATVAAASYYSGRTVPLWTGIPGKPHSEWSYSSFFPNRNQTANVLALAGIAAYAAILDAFRKERFVLLVFLVLALAILCVELVSVYSRAGILLFFGGVVVWQACSFYFSRSAQRAGLAAAGVAIALAAFFLGGGETLSRFQNKNLHELLHGRDFRVFIHRDAFLMAKTAPWLGVGLGNFKALFPLSRLWSVQENTILHPESDWLWIATEMGWVSVALLAAGVALWARKCFPFNEGSSRFLRAAAALCVILFVLHGLEDVSAHRLGALWPALLLASLAVNPANVREQARRPAWLFRLLGLVLAGAGAAWLASYGGHGVFPTSADVERHRQQAADFIEEKDYKDAILSTSKAIKIAPVDWTLYFQRGAAESRASVSDLETRRDFGTARFLEPHWEQLCLQEGLLWFAAGNEEYALNAWEEAMRRALEATPSRTIDPAPGIFRQMLDVVKRDTALRSQLRELSRKDATCLLLFLGSADEVEFDIESLRLLGDDPGLQGFSEAQRRQFFGIWFQNGDRYSLAETLEAHPDFLKIAWNWLALCYASWGRYQDACGAVFKWAPAPALPRAAQGQTLAELQRAYFVNQGDLEKGVALCLEQEKEGQFEAALLTLKSVQSTATPSYIPYIQARLWGEKGDWKQAWTFLDSFLPR